MICLQTLSHNQSLLGANNQVLFVYQQQICSTPFSCPGRVLQQSFASCLLAALAAATAAAAATISLTSASAVAAAAGFAAIAKAMACSVLQLLQLSAPQNNVKDT